MNIKLIVVGSIKEKYYKNLIEEQIRRIKKNHLIQIIELKDESIPKNAGESARANVIAVEGDKILSVIDYRDYVIALCIEGRSIDDDQLEQLIKRESELEKNITFIIGGSLGLDERITKNRANYRLSFSNMTFPHQLMRVILLEKLADITCGR